jgi:predicted P-loop ATPase
VTTTAPTLLPNLVGHAIAYARRGWPCFPLHAPLGDRGCTCGDSECKRAGKHPRTQHGLKDATTDEATIRGWWQQWPDAPIGISTGPAGLVVIDIDPRAGGVATWSALVTSNDPLPPTPTVKTGGGGSHIYLASPPYPVQSKAGALGLGVDVKADGGYVVAPPSLHASGDRYEWRVEANPGDVELAPCPAWLLKRMQSRKPRGQRPDSKLAAAFAAAGWLGKRDRDGRWRCLCPWSKEHGSGSDYDSSTVILPATSEHPRARWLCSHGHCASRTTGDVWGMLPRAAVEAAEEQWAEKTEPLSEPAPSVPAPANTEWQGDLIRSKKGVVACEQNALTILAHDPRWEHVLSWDEFRCRVTFSSEPPWCDTERSAVPLEYWQDDDATRLVAWLHRNWQIRVPTTLAHSAASVVAHTSPVHPVRDYLRGLTWDGVIRCERWLTSYLGVELTDYSQAVGFRWLVSAVARIMRPGCQVDHMLVLEGPQGRRKSTAMRVLCGAAWYADRLSDPGKKDSAEELAGVWIAEYSDLATLRRADVESIKAYVTRRVDRYRPSYGRCIVEQPRQCVFCGTTNEDTYLGDATGGRRFWPVAVRGELDIDGLSRDRDQLLAEAVARFDSGEKWWLETEELTEIASVEQDARYIGDPWQEPVDEWLGGEACQKLCAAYGGVTTRDVLGALGIEVAKRDRGAEMRVSALLRRSGFSRVRVKKNGVRTYYYVKVET